jgi:hypothetical protein
MHPIDVGQLLLLHLLLQQANAGRWGCASAAAGTGWRAASIDECVMGEPAVAVAPEADAFVVQTPLWMLLELLLLLPPLSLLAP